MSVQKRLISAFWATSWQFFFEFFSISRNFVRYYLRAKFQINWTIQTEITEEGRICPPPAIPICKNPGLFRVKLCFSTESQALDGLAPKFELINMHELINKSTNNYVTLLPLENGTNLNTKGWICKNCKYFVYILMRMRETSSYLKLSLATLCHQEIGSFDP